VKSITYFGRTPCTEDQPITRPLPTQNSTTQKNVDIHLCLEQNFNVQSQYSGGPRPYPLLITWQVYTHLIFFTLRNFTSLETMLFKN